MRRRPPVWATLPPSVPPLEVGRSSTPIPSDVTASRNGIQASLTRRSSSARVAIPSAEAPGSEVAGVVVLAIDLLQHRDLLADGRARPGALEEGRHERRARAGRLAQTVDRSAPAVRVARGAHVADALDLAAFDVGVDRERRHLRLARLGVLVDPDDHLLALFDLLLEVERRLDDLPLRI